METTSQVLWQIRVKAFLVQLGTLVAVAIGGVILSPEFRDLVVQHFGTGFVTSSIILFLTGAVSQMLNKMALKKQEVGAAGTSPVILI